MADGRREGKKEGRKEGKDGRLLYSLALGTLRLKIMVWPQRCPPHTPCAS